MKKILKKILLFILNKKLFERFKLIYYKLKKLNSLKIIFYGEKNLKKDLEFNEKSLVNLGFSLKRIKHNLEKNGMDYYNEDLSWHYHIFSGFKNNDKKLKILEIGTGKGNFTNFLSNIFPNSHITTFDLPSNSKEFIKINKRDNLKFRKRYVKQRNKNLKKKNISFIAADSFNLLEKFNKNTFDLIWVDGDHSNPQCAIDIFQSILLLKKKSVIITDDIIKEYSYNKYFKNYYQYMSGFLNLKKLEEKKILKNYYFIKRIRNTNAIIKKYIAYSIINN